MQRIHVGRLLRVYPQPQLLFRRARNDVLAVQVPPVQEVDARDVLVVGDVGGRHDVVLPGYARRHAGGDDPVPHESRAEPVERLRHGIAHRIPVAPPLSEQSEGLLDVGGHARLGRCEREALQLPGSLRPESLEDQNKEVEHHRRHDLLQKHVPLDVLLFDFRGEGEEDALHEANGPAHRHLRPVLAEVQLLHEPHDQDVRRIQAELLGDRDWRGGVYGLLLEQLVAVAASLVGELVSVRGVEEIAEVHVLPAIRLPALGERDGDAPPGIVAVQQEIGTRRAPFVDGRRGGRGLARVEAVGGGARGQCGVLFQGLL